MCEVVDHLVNMGKSEGLREGESAERIRIIKSMQKKGMSLQEISELLELSIEKVEELIDEK